MSANQTEQLPEEMLLKSGGRLVLRKAKPQDAAAMIEYLNAVGGESDNLVFGNNEFHLTVEQETEYLKQISEEPNILMLLGLVANEIASIAQIACPGRKRIAHNSDISVSVRKKYWSCGIGTAVMERLIRFARENGSIRNISLAVRADNAAAIHLYEKLGFQKVGFHKDYFNINGVYYDEVLMDLLI